MVGWVPSVLPYLQRARITVVPLLHGAGTKRKLLQALKVGTPTVSTSIGVEGVNIEDGVHVLTADDPTAFAQAMVRLLKHPSLWKRLSENGADYVTKVYGREAVQERFLKAVSAVMARKVKTLDLVEAPTESNRTMVGGQQYQKLRERLQALARAELPQDATVIVVSKGDDRLLHLNGRKAWHFPRSEDGTYAGYYPANSAEAMAHLETLREKGGDYLIFPSTAFWWFNYYGEFKQHLETHYRIVCHQEDTCTIFALREGRGLQGVTRENQAYSQ
jgi:hypothetical protein